MVGDAAVVVAAKAAVVVAVVVSAATAPGAAAQAAAGGRPCNATKMEVQFYYTKLRVFLVRKRPPSGASSRILAGEGSREG